MSLASELGVSLGHINALVDLLHINGFIHLKQTTTNKRRSYLYTLTNLGVLEMVSSMNTYFKSLRTLYSSVESEILSIEQITNQLTALLNQKAHI